MSSELPFPFNAHPYLMRSPAEHQNHVAGGYKATLHNPNVSEDAKDRAQQKLQEMGRSENDQPIPNDEKNPNNVAGKCITY